MVCLSKNIRNHYPLSTHLTFYIQHVLCIDVPIFPRYVIFWLYQCYYLYLFEYINRTYTRVYIFINIVHHVSLKSTRECVFLLMQFDVFIRFTISSVMAKFRWLLAFIIVIFFYFFDCAFFNLQINSILYINGILDGNNYNQVVIY